MKSRAEMQAELFAAQMMVQEIQWDLDRPDMTNPYRMAREDKEASEAFHSQYTFSTKNYANPTGTDGLQIKDPGGFGGVQV